jgi:NAD(P)-dependent dehydrogenase (short-subunit alcohol dehydrogenase family)
LTVNLVAPFELAREAARTMVASGNGGVIVNVASLWGMVGVGQIPEAGYAASKGGLINLTRELAAQWARKGVRVNALAPGWFRSEMTEGRMFGDDRAEKWMNTRTPMGRGGDEHELDGALLFLASAASTFVTGTVLCVDGGWTAI